MAQRGSFGWKFVYRSLLSGAILTAMVLAGLQLPAVHAQGVSLGAGTDCSNSIHENDVIWCGASSVSQLVGKYRGGDGHNPAASIQNIFSHFGISRADINGMGDGSLHVEAGQVTKAGDVYGAGGNLLATGAMTGGRQNMAGSTPVTSGGTTFYTRPPSVSFLTNSLSAYVVTVNGRFSFAILSSCGNPVIATPKTPAPAPKPTPKPAPKPATPAPPPAPPAAVQPATTNLCSGDSSSTATNAANSGIIQSGNCNTSIVTNTTAAAPSAPVCEDLGISTAGAATDSETADATAATDSRTVTVTDFETAANGGTLTGTDVNWGDGTTTTGVANPIGLTHQYVADGTYTVSVAANFAVNGQNVTAAGPVCQQQISFAAPPPPAAPAATTPTPTPPPAAPATAPAAPVQSAPSTLVNTGPGSVLAVFSVATTVSALGYRFLLVRRLRA